MAESIVRDWLAEYKGLDTQEVHSFASSECQSNEVVQAILTVLQEKKYFTEFLEPVCHQLFSFYRSQESLLHIFTLQCVPTLIALYLTSISRGELRNVKCVEVLLLGLYNLEVIDPASGNPVVHTFRIPSIAKPSVYHEPMSLAQPALTENALFKLEQGDSRTISIGPYPEMERIIASNRLQVLTVVMQVYNRHVSQLNPLSHYAVCKASSRIVRQGYPRQGAWTEAGNRSAFSLPRIQLSSSLLLEFLHAVYFAMFNGAASVGLQALDDIHFRACQDLLHEVLLVTNAVRNSLRANPSGQPSDGPMGISISLSPSTSAHTLSSSTTGGKGLITNASFRTKKLPDDIPILHPKEESKDALGSIQEEGSGEVPPVLGKKTRRGSTSSIGSSSLLQIIKPPKKDPVVVASVVNGSSKLSKPAALEEPPSPQPPRKAQNGPGEFEPQSLGQAMSTASPEDLVPSGLPNNDSVTNFIDYQEGSTGSTEQAKTTTLVAPDVEIILTSLDSTTPNTGKVIFQPNSNHKYDKPMNTIV